MKNLFIALLAFSVQPAFAEEPGCPSLMGEYVANSCPSPKTAFQSVVIRQPDCRNIGYQTINRSSTGAITKFGPIRWESVGGGRLDQREDASTIYSRESFFSGFNLYSYNYRTVRSSGATNLVNVELISLLQQNNLFISHSDAGGGKTWFFLPNCKF